MDWKSIAGTVGNIAGTVAPLLAGPAGLAVSIGAQIASILGTDNDPKAVLKELQNNPNAALKLQEWAHQERDNIRAHNLRLEEVALAQYKAELLDRQHARQEHRDHWMPAALTIGLLIMFAILLGALFFMAPPQESRELIVFLVGNLFPLLAAAITYWVSDTKASADKDKLIDRLKSPDKELV
ncbi:hypothetical protein [Shewanella xiamenensis]|uniref:hypothetical protein n=1 Tax=Shewanella xiamenensis TaxID=332186 RepID=UPI000849E73E|nr:hypothetical protein [Shewanella xiamenensis]ODR86732.1 hypothetical protein ABT47_16185 [Shewanella xiamenensis]